MSGRTAVLSLTLALAAACSGPDPADNLDEPQSPAAANTTTFPDLTLPAGVTVPEPFERDSGGLAVDLERAEERYYRCMDDSGHPVEHLALDELLDRTGDIEDEEFQLIHMLCSEAAGTGWYPGNRPDEAAARNRQAWATTECLRQAGLTWPDPRPESLGRYVELAFAYELFHSASADLSAEDVSVIVQECVDEHSIDWQQWFQENPRN